MQEKSFKPLQIVHLLLILGAAVMTVIGMFRLFAGDAVAGNTPDPGAVKPGLYASAGVCAIHLAALVCGAVYTFRGYTKADVNYYRMLIGLMIPASICGGIAIALFQGFQPVMLLHVPRIVLLLLLLVGKDLGKKKSFVFYYIILAIDIFSCVANFQAPGPLASKIGTIFTTLMIAGTLGLTINGKYLDKSARGTQ